MKAQTVLLLVILLITSAACESNSGRRANTALQPSEKVVIIEVDKVYTEYSLQYARYKIRRIGKGVVTFVTISKSEGVYSVNDTIFYKF